MKILSFVLLAASAAWGQFASAGAWSSQGVMSAGSSSGGGNSGGGGGGGGGIAENAYCTSGDTPAFGGGVDGPATLPTACVFTDMSGSPHTGSTVTVTAGSASDLQSKLTAASCGQTIKVPAVVASVQQNYSGTFTIPALSCPGSNWVIVETDQIANANFQAEHSRITPGWAGLSSLPGRPAYAQPTGGAAIYVPKLINNGTVLNFTAGASHWRFIGLELTTTAGTTVVSNLVSAAGVDHIIFDRVISRGGNNATWQSPDNLTRNFYFAGTTYWAVINSYVGEAHCIANGACNDSQNILSGGPGKVYNNFLEVAGGGTVAAGGGGPTLSAVDLEIRGNHMFKPLFWKTNDASYFGTNFIVKNALEFKDANRVLVEGNIMEYTWGQQSDQFGQLVLLGAKNQSVKTFGNASSDGLGTLTATGASTFPSSVVGAGCATPNHCAINYNAAGYQAQTWIDSTHITVSPLPPASAGAAFTACQPGADPTAAVTNITLRYNILRHASRGVGVFEAGSDCGDRALGTNNISIHDDVLDDINGVTWNLTGGACCSTSYPWEILNGDPTPSNTHDISIVHTTGLALVTASWVGDGPSWGIMSQSATSSTIGNLIVRDNISAAGLRRASAGVCTGTNTALANLQCMSSTFCFDHNVLATTTLGSFSGTANNPAWPGVGDSPNCGFTTTGQQFPANYAVIGFVDLNNANGGDYHLCHTGTPGCNAVSPYVGTASDGTDPGANIDLVNQYTANSQ